MNTAMSTRNRTQWTAGTIAVLASLLTVGGPLMLAEHYAQTGSSGHGSGYYAAEQTRRSVCPDNGNSRTAAVSARRDVEMSLYGVTV